MQSSSFLNYLPEYLRDFSEIRAFERAWVIAAANAKDIMNAAQRHFVFYAKDDEFVEHWRQAHYDTAQSAHALYNELKKMLPRSNFVTLDSVTDFVDKEASGDILPTEYDPETCTVTVKSTWTVPSKVKKYIREMIPANLKLEILEKVETEDES